MHLMIVTFGYEHRPPPRGASLVYDMREMPVTGAVWEKRSGLYPAVRILVADTQGFNDFEWQVTLGIKHALLARVDKNGPWPLIVAMGSKWGKQKSRVIVDP